MSSNAKLAAFQTKIADKVKKALEITYKDISVPTAAQNVLDSYLAAASPQTSASNIYRIDVCPDFTPAFCYLLLEANALRPTIAAAKNPKVSVYTLVAYELHLIYIWFLLHDLYVAPLDCSYANDLISDKIFSDHLEFCLDLPVPQPVINVISYWSTTCLENQANIWLTPSFNNFLLQTHFGRSFPTTILFAMHNTIATNSANAKNPDLLYEFATTALFNVKEFVPNPFDTTPAKRSRTFTPNHFFSLITPDATLAAKPAPLANKINQILLAFASFDSIKGLKAASPYANIPLAAPKFIETNGFLNPYIMLTALTTKNTSELTTVYRAVSSVIHLQKLANKSLAVLFTDIPSSGLGNHGYSDFNAPHWDAYPKSVIADPANAVSKIGSTDIDNHVAAIAFKTNTLVSSDQTALPFPTWHARARNLLQVSFRAFSNVSAPITSLSARISTTITNASALAMTDLTTQHQDIVIPYADLTTVTNFDALPFAADTTTDPTDAMINDFPTGPFKKFHDHHDVYPTVKVIMPQGYSSSAAPLVPLRGLVIFSEDITGSIVPQLRSRSEIYDDNAQFLQSAISFASTHLATDFNSKHMRPSRATDVPLTTATTQSAVSLLRSNYTSYAPYVTPTTFDLGLNLAHYGLTRPAAMQRIPQYIQTFYGHAVHTRAKTDAAHIANGPANTPTGHILLWSPYTYRAPSLQLDTSDPTDTISVADALRGTYFLSNLRTLFGTSQVVTSVESALHALPSA